MRLILLRHGKAEPESSTGRDADRLLKPRGEHQARFVAQSLAARSPAPRLILSSGIVRAIQTARILQQHLACTLQVEPALETGAAPSDVIDLIARRRDANPDAPLVLVGHNPTFENVAGILAGGPTAITSGGGTPEIRTGEALVFDLPDPPAELVGACTLIESIRLADD